VENQTSRFQKKEIISTLIPKIKTIRFNIIISDSTKYRRLNNELKEKFIKLWKKYFNNVELPITFYYTDEEGHAEVIKPGSVPRCLIGALSNVRKGKSCCFDAGSIGASVKERILVLQKR